MGVATCGFKITDDGDFKTQAVIRELLAEFMGTFYLIFIGCGGKEMLNYETWVLLLIND